MTIRSLSKIACALGLLDHAERPLDRSGETAGTDAGGYPGLEDEVDDHRPELFKSARLSTVLGVGSGADNGNNTAILQALRLGAVRCIRPDGKSFGEDPVRVTLELPASVLRDQDSVEFIDPSQCPADRGS